MGLREEIQTDVAEAFDTDLSDAVKKINYKSITINDYVPDHGSPEKITNEEKTRGVFATFDKSEVDNEKILPTDINLIVLQNEIGSEIKIDDLVVELDSSDNPVKTYVVIAFSKDPADATYSIQIRTLSDTK